jgi:LmbE family N-acetylglucosaminyl deacetylase
MKKKVLVIAAHPDDEMLGCGGTIARHTSNQDNVTVMVLGEGITSRTIKRNVDKKKNQLQQLKEKTRKANKILGVKNIIFENLPDNRFDDLNILDVTKKIEKVLFNFKPNIIYTHSGLDLNRDHQIVNEAVITACRPQKNNFLEKILLFEVPSSSEWSSTEKNQFSPNYFVDISSFFKKKTKALKIYKSEIKKWPHPRSFRGIEYLARLRGAQVGCEFAESFYTLREINFE